MYNFNKQIKSNKIIQMETGYKQRAKEHQMDSSSLTSDLFRTKVRDSFAGFLQGFQQDICVFIRLDEDLLVRKINIKLNICW